MATPSFKQLEAFYWAASCANFSSAAQRLHLSVSSLSKRIAELEQCLNLVLFDRSTYRATLTADGKRLLPSALQVLESMAALQQQLPEQAVLAGSLSFGVGELSALTWLPRLVSVIRQQHPQLQLRPHVDVGAALEEKLDAGTLDFAVIAGHSSRSGIQSSAVATARFAWVAASSLLQGQTLSVSQLLQQYPLITLPGGAGTTRILDDWLLSTASHCTQRIECNNWVAIAGMLQEGVGVGFLPQGWARSVAGSGLVELSDEPPLAALHYAFQWRRGDARSMIPAMRELVRQCAGFQQGLAEFSTMAGHAGDEHLPANG